MNTRSIEYEERFHSSPEETFALLHTPSKIRGWWGVSRAIVLPETGGFWTVTWGENEDEPEYIATATIREFHPPRRLVLADYRYHAKAGSLPFEADFLTTFTVTPTDDGSLLHVRQEGFPAASEADAFYNACIQGWKDTFLGIRRFLTL